MWLHMWLHPLYFDKIYTLGEPKWRRLSFTLRCPLFCSCFPSMPSQIMVGEGIVYCLQSKIKGRGSSEGSINAGGCNFNSFLRRTVRFVGKFCCLPPYYWVVFSKLWGGGVCHCSFHSALQKQAIMCFKNNNSAHDYLYKSFIYVYKANIQLWGNLWKSDLLIFVRSVLSYPVLTIIFLDIAIRGWLIWFITMGVKRLNDVVS